MGSMVKASIRDVSGLGEMVGTELSFITLQGVWKTLWMDQTDIEGRAARDSE